MPARKGRRQEDDLMAERYTLSPTKLAVLRALEEAAVEVSPNEVAVTGRLLPNQARTALIQLEAIGLVRSPIPATGRTDENEPVFVLNSEGKSVSRAIAQFKGTPPVGTILQINRPFYSFSEWFSKSEPEAKGLNAFPLKRRQTPSLIEIVSDDFDPNTR
jgi:hypothetical protein